MKIFKGIYSLIVCVFVFVLITSYSYRVFATEQTEETVRSLSDDEIPTVAELIATQIQDNYEQIHIWSGEIDVKLNMYHTGARAEDIFKKLGDGKDNCPETILQKAQEKTVFVITAEKDDVYVDNIRANPCEFLDPTTGKNIGDMSGPYYSGPNQSTIIARPDYTLQATPVSFNKKDNTISRRLAIKKPSQRESVGTTGLYVGIDDPRKTFVPGGVFTWDHLRRLIKEFDKTGSIEVDGYKFQVEEREKDNVTEYIFTEPAIISMERSDPSHYVIRSKVFSSQYGLNMTAWKLTSGNGLLRQEFFWEYKLVDGIYLPKRTIERYYNSNGEIYLEKDSLYSKQVLNQVIPTGTFEFINLNLKDGDLYNDEIQNKKYTIKAGKLVEDMK